MSDILIRLLALTRHGPTPVGPLCVKCMDASLREELASLSRAADLAQLAEEDP